MKPVRILEICALLFLCSACSHPLEIFGEGDLESTSGLRDCSLEDYQAEGSNCAKNYVISDYSESYRAEPRPDWEFACWGNVYQEHCDNSAAATDECSFDVPANWVRNYWGAVMPPLTAHFTPEPETLPPPPAPLPFSVSTIPLPAEVKAAAALWTPDGSRLVLVTTMADESNQVALIDEDGSNYECLTCGLPDIDGVKDEGQGFLADGNSLYIGSHVLECAPSITDCQTPELIPVEPITTPYLDLGTTTKILSPDGIHIGVTKLTSRVLVLAVMGELSRVSDELGDRYDVINTKVIAGDKHFENDFDNLIFPLNASGEVKRFMDGGRSFGTVGVGAGGNFDVLKTDLATGEVSRFTKHFSYDEANYESPNGEWVIVQTNRTTERMDVFGLVPRPFFTDFGVARSIGYYRNQVIDPPAERRRYYGLTLLDKYGDRARLPEEGYVGQDLTVAPDNITTYNQFKKVSWHKDSTRIVFWEQKDPELLALGEQHGRLRLLEFTSLSPTTPLVPFTPDPTWAQPLDENFVPPEYAQEGTVAGAVSGYAEVSYYENSTDPGGMAINGHIDVTYVNYSEDGKSVLNGTENVDYSLASGTTWDADVTVTGCNQGSFKTTDVTLFVQSIGSGTIRAELNGRVIEEDIGTGLPTGVPGERK